MDFWELAMILLRRWYAFVPVLLATVGLTYFGTEAPETIHHAQSTVLVTRIPDDLAGLNPYARDETTAQTMATIMGSPEAREEVIAAGGSEVFTVTPAAERSALLLVQGSAGADEEALATTSVVIEAMQERLQALQTEAGVKPRAPRSRVVVVSPPSLAAPETGSRLRELGVGIAVGGLLAVAVALAVEGLARRRAKKRSAEDPAAPVVEDAAESGDAEESAAQEQTDREPADEASASSDEDPSAEPERELLSR
ncbi:hypothetical protein FB381_3896 [Nocardioides albertanoniae]|uniref:Capsular polysaccharide biosynthesis protein n=1 Tax=Nocardioides albertanoniae TaxID=1175486 RepID=A0A543ABJ2_9ACTN|nr:hypothetical protein [Nocardioides albertanoniae]TQL69973.1 hypothetical protein FB381_3896 [Nocardioides albertanoniae]